MVQRVHLSVLLVFLVAAEYCGRRRDAFANFVVVRQVAQLTRPRLELRLFA